jgi:hypothetical protein
MDQDHDWALGQQQQDAAAMSQASDQAPDGHGASLAAPSGPITNGGASGI